MGFFETNRHNLFKTAVFSKHSCDYFLAISRTYPTLQKVLDRFARGASPGLKESLKGLKADLEQFKGNSLKAGLKAVEAGQKGQAKKATTKRRSRKNKKA